MPEKPYLRGAKGVLGETVSIRRILEIARVPKERHDHLIKVYDKIVEPHKADLLDMLEKKASSVPEGVDVNELLPSTITELHPFQYGVFPTVKAMFPKEEWMKKLGEKEEHAKNWDEITKATEKEWVTLEPSRRSGFTKGKTSDKGVKASGRLRYAPDDEENWLPMELWHQQRGRIEGGGKFGLMCTEFAGSLEIADALLKNKLWKKYKERVRIPLSIGLLKEIYVGGKTVDSEDFKEMMKERYKESYGESPDYDEGLLTKIEELTKDGFPQYQYVQKKPYQRIGRVGIDDNVITIPREEFMKAHGFTAEDVENPEKVEQALKKFTHDLAEFISTLHKEGVTLTTLGPDYLTTSAISAKDLGPEPNFGDFDTIGCEKWGEDVSDEQLAWDFAGAKFIIKRLTEHMGLGEKMKAEEMPKKAAELFRQFTSVYKTNSPHTVDKVNAGLDNIPFWKD